MRDEIIEQLLLIRYQCLNRSVIEIIRVPI